MRAKPDSTTFKKPHAWATYSTARSVAFKTHSTLGMCKTAIAGLNGAATWVHINGKREYKSPVNGDWWVYRFDPDLDEWVEVYFIPAGTWRHKHVLWSDSATNPTRKAKSVSQEAVDEAIASVLSATKLEAT